MIKRPRKTPKPTARERDEDAVLLPSSGPERREKRFQAKRTAQERLENARSFQPGPGRMSIVDFLNSAHNYAPFMRDDGTVEFRPLKGTEAAETGLSTSTNLTEDEEKAYKQVFDNNKKFEERLSNDEVVSRNPKIRAALLAAVEELARLDGMSMRDWLMEEFEIEARGDEGAVTDSSLNALLDDDSEMTHTSLRLREGMLEATKDAARRAGVSQQRWMRDQFRRGILGADAVPQRTGVSSAQEPRFAGLSSSKRVKKNAVSLRLEEELQAAVEAAVEESGFKSNDWLRAALVKALTEGLDVRAVLEPQSADPKPESLAGQTLE